MKALIVTVAILSAAGMAKAAMLTSQSFGTDAATAGLAEIQLGRLAAQKSSNAAVKQFAAMMVKDHTAAAAKLKAVAHDDKIALPKAPTPEQRAVGEKLAGKSGGDFDTAYAAQMVKDHERAVALFQEASESPDLDPNLRTFAAKTLPTLEHHLAEAKKLNDIVAHGT